MNILRSVLILGLFITADAGYAAPLYRVTPLPIATPQGLNNAGQIVGLNGSSEIRMWQDGVTTTVATMPSAFPAYTSGQRFGNINMSENGTLGGQIAGSIGAVEHYLAVKYTGGLAVDLGALPGSVSVFPGGISANLQAINDSGHGVGFCTDSSGNGHPVLWSGGTVTSLAAGSGFAVDINNAGQYVGSSTSDALAFFFNGGATVSLAALPGDTITIPAALNGAGMAIGSSQAGSSDPASSVVIWNNGGLPSEICTVTNGTYNRAVDINASSEALGKVIVGGSFISWYYDGAGECHFVNDLLDPSDPVSTGTVVTAAVKINDQGWIIARGTTNGVSTGLLLKPIVPEPVLEISSFGFSASSNSPTFWVSVFGRTGFNYELRKSTNNLISFDVIKATAPGADLPLNLQDSDASSESGIYIVTEDAAP